MRQTDVDEVIQQAAQAGRKVSDYEAAAFCGAREILAREPDNPHAAKVVENFLAFLTTGAEVVCFDEFFLPVPYTVEELAEQNESREAYLKATGQTAKS